MFSIFSFLLHRSNAADRVQTEGDYIPLVNLRSRKSHWDATRLTRDKVIAISALAVAVLVGIVIGFCFAYFDHPPQYGFLSPNPSSQESSSRYTSSTHPSPLAVPAAESLSLEALRDIVTRTKGYLARDYSLNLGWNNVSNCCMHAQ
jgi:hypothetical protein